MKHGKLRGTRTIQGLTDSSTRLSLARSDHTLCVVGSKAYIFGGETAAGKLSSNDVHCINLDSSDNSAPNYSIIPAIPEVEGGEVPEPRKRHAACALNVCVAMFGGSDDVGGILKKPHLIWLFNTATSKWETLENSNPDIRPSPRSSTHLFSHRNNLILHGGRDPEGNLLVDTWHFDYVNKFWTQLADAPVASGNVTLSDGVLYLVAGTDVMSGDLHFLQLTAKSGESQGWQTVSFPTSPLTPGPLPRTGATLLPISTGYGRQYLLFGFGAQPPAVGSGIEAEVSHQSTPAEGFTPPQFWSDLWTYQLPSSTPEVKVTTNIYEAMKPAKIKDAIRGALGVDSGKHSWAEVEVLPPADLVEDAGKVHPGPRSYFASDITEDRKTVILWGGVNPKGEREGDGWMIKLE